MKALGKRPILVTTKSDFGISNEDVRLHTVAQHFVADLGMKSIPPDVKAGSDVGELTWVPVSQIKLSESKEDGRSTYQGTPIRLDYGTVTLSACVREIRNHVISGKSQKNFSNAENVAYALQSRLKSFFSSPLEMRLNLLGHPPRAEVGLEAHLYHLKILKVLEFLQSYTIRTASSFSIELRENLKNEICLAESLDPRLKFTR